jgi:hypothetical protein
VYVAAFDPELRPLLGVGRVHQVNPPEPIRGPDQFLPTSAIDEATGRLWVCDYQTPAEGSTRARFTCEASDDGGQTWSRPVPATRTYSDESRPPANVNNGYGDYEAATVAGGSLVAAWTDGRMVFERRKEEIFAARINERKVVVKK